MFSTCLEFKLIGETLMYFLTGLYVYMVMYKLVFLVFLSRHFVFLRQGLITWLKLAWNSITI